MQSTSWLKDVFCIPCGNQYIIYLPLDRIVFSANSTLVNLLYKAGRGDNGALKALQIESGLLQQLADRGESIREKMINRNVPPFSPRAVSLFLTNKCTFQCRYCYARGGDRMNDMDWETITGVLDAVLRNVKEAHSRRMTVHFHGGGDISASWPLLVRTKAYLDSLLLENDLQLHTSIATNGCLDEKQQQWITANINRATVSLDGIPEIQNAHRPLMGGGASFGFVDKTLRAFDKARFPYGIRMTVSSMSVRKLEASIEFICKNYKTKSIKAEPLFPRGRALQSALTAPGTEEFLFFFRKARVIAHAYGKKLIYSGVRPELVTPVFCQAAGNSCAVTPEGLVTSCYEVLAPGDPLLETFCYGHFNRTKRNFVIDEEKRKALYGFTVFNRSFCENCFCKYHCAGDCPVKVRHDTDHGHAATPERCYITRELTKDYLMAALR